MPHTTTTTTTNTLATLLIAMLAAGAAAAALAMLAVATTMPEVHISHSTGGCVAIVEPNGTRRACPADIDDMPERYHHIWVQ